MKFKKFSFKLSQSTLSTSISLMVGLSFYSLILFFGLPEPLNQFFSEAQDSTIFILLIFAVLYVAYVPVSRTGILSSFTATVSLFAAQLAGGWHNLAGINHYAFSGLFPYSDADLYYISSLGLLEGKPFHVAASWRPLSHGAIATLLGLTQQNLQLTIAILICFIAVSCFFLANEVKSTHGVAPAVLIILLAFLFIRPFIGTLGTENLGLTFGLVGVAFLWRGLKNKAIKWCLGGIFLFTLGLNIRAGTFFILPAFLICGAWTFRYKSRFSWKFLLGGFSVILLGFLINSFIFKLVAFPGITPNGNFSVVLYGMAVEGNWLSFSEDHPGVTDEKEIYRLALQAIMADPLVLIRGFWRACGEFFKDSFLFSFIKSSPMIILVKFFALTSIFSLYRQRKTLIPWFMLTGLIGFVISLPFVPPWDAGIRVYATTTPFLAIFPALGLSFILSFLPKLSSRKISEFEEISRSKLLITFTVILVALVSMGTLITQLLSSQPKFGEISCPANTEVVYFRNSKGSSLNLVADETSGKTYLPNLLISDFKNYILPNPTIRNSPEFINSGFYPLYQALETLPAGTQIMSKIPLTNSKESSTKIVEGVWIIGDNNLFPQNNGIVGACGKSLKMMPTSDYHGNLFFADSMELLSQ